MSNILGNLLLRFRSDQRGITGLETAIVLIAFVVVMMEVDPEGEEAFERWYNDEHLPERLEIPGYVSARRFKLEEGNGVLKYLCIWELEDASPLQSDQYKAQRARICRTRACWTLRNGSE